MHSAALARLARPGLAVLALVLVPATAASCAQTSAPPVASAGAWPVRAIAIAGADPGRVADLLDLEIDAPSPSADAHENLANIPSRVALRDLGGDGHMLGPATLRAVVRAIAEDYARRGEIEVRADILPSDLAALLAPGSNGTLVVRIRRGARSSASAY